MAASSSNEIVLTDASDEGLSSIVSKYAPQVVDLDLAGIYQLLKQLNYESKERDLIYILTYMCYSLRLIQKNTEYVPKHELEQLIKALEFIPKQKEIDVIAGKMLLSYLAIYLERNGPDVPQLLERLSPYFERWRGFMLFPTIVEEKIKQFCLKQDFSVAETEIHSCSTMFNRWYHDKIIPSSADEETSVRSKILINRWQELSEILVISGVQDTKTIKIEENFNIHIDKLISMDFAKCLVDWWILSDNLHRCGNSFIFSEFNKNLNFVKNVMRYFAILFSEGSPVFKEDEIKKSFVLLLRSLIGSLSLYDFFNILDDGINKVIINIFDKTFLDALQCFYDENCTHELLYDNFYETALMSCYLRFVQDPEIVVETTVLPLLFQLKLSDLSSEIKEAFFSFVMKVKKHNDSAELHRKVDLAYFFAVYQPIIFQLLSLMGVEAVKWLQSKLVNGLTSLESFLSFMSIFTIKSMDELQAYYKKWLAVIQGNRESVHDWRTCLLMLNLFCFLKDRDVFATHHLLFSKDLSTFLLNPPDKIKQELSTVLLGLFINKTVDIEQLLLKLPLERLYQIMAAGLRMERSSYQEAFKAMFHIDLNDGSMDDFLHNQENSGLSGLIAIHNRKIADALNAANIRLKEAYTTSYTFSISAENNGKKAQRVSPYKQLYSYLPPLMTAIENELNSEMTPEKIKKTLVTIKDTYETIMKNLNKEISSGRDLDNALIRKKEILKPLFKKIYNFLEKIKTYPLSSSYHEFSEHYQNEYKALGQAVTSITKSEMHHDFKVALWDKGNPDTFFLGDHVGCCLASNGSQFSAMVQRRLDDAMLFAVATDCETQKPAALLWLFLAVCEEGKIVMVANFAEVNAKYASSESLRRGLLQGLLTFTQRCCQRAGIGEFYMNQLRYGHNMGDLEYFDFQLETPRLLDKVGGAFVPDLLMGDDANKMTIEYYYLASLQPGNTRFFRFDPACIERRSVPGLIEHSPSSATSSDACSSSSMAGGASSFQFFSAQAASSVPYVAKKPGLG